MKALRKLARRLASIDPFAVTRQLTVREQPVIFDVGAHTGESARRYRTLFADAHIFCFEPFPSSFELLTATVAGDPLIDLHPVALSDSDGTAQLTVNRSNQTNSLLASDERAARYWGDGLLTTDGVIDVRTQTLDAFCRQANVAHIDILKLDVQGAEYAVLTGAREMLARQAIDLVYMEMIAAPTYVGQRKLHEYLALFDSHGYEIFDLYNAVRSNGRLIQTDNLMISSACLERVERASRSS